MQPADGIVAVKPASLDNVLVGNLTVVSKDKPEIGEVVAIGQPTPKKPLPIKGLRAGDIIAYRRYGESKFFLGGKELYFIDFPDCLAILKKGVE